MRRANISGYCADWSQELAAMVNALTCGRNLECRPRVVVVDEGRVSVEIATGDLDRILQLLHPMVGSVVSEAGLSPFGGSWITIEVGGFTLWVSMAAWRIEDRSAFLVACE